MSREVVADLIAALDSQLPYVSERRLQHVYRQLTDGDLAGVDLSDPDTSKLVQAIAKARPTGKLASAVRWAREMVPTEAPEPVNHIVFTTNTSGWYLLLGNYQLGSQGDPEGKAPYFPLDTMDEVNAEIRITNDLGVPLALAADAVRANPDGVVFGTVTQLKNTGSTKVQTPGNARYSVNVTNSIAVSSSANIASAPANLMPGETMICKAAVKYISGTKYPGFGVGFIAQSR